MNAPEVVERLVTDNVRLAYFFAKGDDEILSASLAGLLAAAERWEASRGHFGAFASRVIHNHIIASYRWDHRMKRGRDVIHVSLESEAIQSVKEIEPEWMEELERLPEMLSQLDEREQMVLRQHYGIDTEARSFSAIAVAIKKTKACAHLIEKRALAKLRQSFNLIP